MYIACKKYLCCVFHRPLCILNISYIDQTSPNTVRYLLLCYVNFILLFWSTLFCTRPTNYGPTHTGLCTHNCCTSYYLYAYVFLPPFPINLFSLVPIILEEEFYTHIYDIYILRFMFMFAIDDKPTTVFTTHVLE